MSLDELKQQDLLLPEEHWSKIDLHTSVNKTALAAVLCLGLASVALMVMGQGRWVTWLGALLFVVFMILFTFVSMIGVDRQTRLLQELSSQTESPRKKRRQV